MSAFDTVPPDVDEITNWRDFRFKDRAIDYTLLRGDAMLDLSEYDTRRSFRCGRQRQSAHRPCGARAGTAAPGR